MLATNLEFFSFQEISSTIEYISSMSGVVVGVGASIIMFYHVQPVRQYRLRDVEKTTHIKPGHCSNTQVHQWSEINE